MPDRLFAVPRLAGVVLGKWRYFMGSCCMSLTVGAEVPPNDRAELESWLRSPSLRAGLAQRARIVLLAADGVGTNEIVHRVGVSKPAVIRWKRRYAAEGVAGLDDRAKSGRPLSIDPMRIVLATLEPPPERLGVTDACYPRHRNEEFLAFLKQVAKAYPRRQLHIVVDNYATHKHDNVTAWLGKNKRITLHFTPTSGSWLNLVSEIFFGIITAKPSDAAPSHPSRTSSARSRPSSTAGTNDASRSSGPNPPTTSSRRQPKVTRLQ